MLDRSSTSVDGNVVVHFSPLLLHSGIRRVNYWAVTWWLEFNLAFEQKVLGVQPLLRVLRNFLMNLILFFLGLCLLVLRLVSVQLLEHFSKFLDLRLVNVLWSGGLAILFLFVF